MTPDGDVGPTLQQRLDDNSPGLTAEKLPERLLFSVRGTVTALARMIDTG
jgi:hypothetical protein